MRHVTRHFPEIPLQNQKSINHRSIHNAQVIHKISIRITPKYIDIFLMSLSKENKN